MKPFTALDEILHAGALTEAPSRGVTPAASTDFQPLFAANALTPPAETRVAEAAHCDPQVEVVQQDGRIQQIVVVCRCGERTVLDCAY